MTVPNQRDPDEVQAIKTLQNDHAALKGNVISRWGRIPHVAADPTSPPDGADWIRSDTGEFRYRANGVTVALDSRYVTAPTAWTAVTFQNAWVNLGAPWQVCQYRKRGDKVELRGLMMTGTIGLAAFTLPAGFRPPAGIGFATQSNGLFGSMTVDAAGVFTPVSGSNVAYWVNCEFSVTA